MTFGIGSMIADQEMYKNYTPPPVSKEDRKLSKYINKFLKKREIKENSQEFYVMWGCENLLEIKVINSAFSSIAQELADEVKQQFSMESDIWIKPEVVLHDPFGGSTPEEYFSH